MSDTSEQISFSNKFKIYIVPFFQISFIYILLGFLVRILLIFNTQTELHFSLPEWLQIFGLGMANDFCISILAYFFLWLCLIFLSDTKYNPPLGYIIFILLLGCLLYVFLFNSVFNQYGGVIPLIAKIFIGFKFTSFGFRLFFPGIRKEWDRINYYLVYFLYISIILFIGVSEYFFWEEFGVRYNFIAVDYLIYTNEVIGNISESYPIIPLFSILFLCSTIISYLFLRKENKNFEKYPSLKNKIIFSCFYFIIAYLAFLCLNFNTKFQNHENVYSNELQANGIYKFGYAYINKKINYTDFYKTIPQKEATSIINKMYHSTGIQNLQKIQDSLPEIHKNIVLITVESLSASFLNKYGNQDNITPNLDTLIRKSLVFNQLYATGNRTVRGLEAVTLCLPPSPGESIVKRPNNENLFTTGKLLKEKGYIVQYLYGGDSYFDNMKTFFSGNGYEIIDKNNFTNQEISFSNIWGVCDEDMFNKAIKVFNKNAQTDKPFFGHIMTVSNHRPFSYPEGKIDISPDSRSRKGGVKYTDFAIGEFIKKAKKQSWFSNTVFVIVADHCASSAGKTEIPLENYHIPALIYSPDFIHPGEVNTLVSQIDLLPTVFGLLHFSYDSEFYGKNIFSKDFIPKAFVATYQNLGYLNQDIFTILSPVRKIEQFYTEKSSDYPFKIDLKSIKTEDSLHLKNAISNYQTVDYFYRDKIGLGK